MFRVPHVPPVSSAKLLSQIDALHRQIEAAKQELRLAQVESEQLDVCFNAEIQFKKEAAETMYPLMQVMVTKKEEQKDECDKTAAELRQEVAKMRAAAASHGTEHTAAVSDFTQFVAEQSLNLVNMRKEKEQICHKKEQEFRQTLVVKQSDANDSRICADPIGEQGAEDDTVFDDLEEEWDLVEADMEFQTTN